MQVLRLALPTLLLSHFLFLLQNLPGCSSARGSPSRGLQQASAATAYLAGGREAPKKRYSYIVSLRTPRQRLHGCGGVLIDPLWILTAAHCVDPKMDFSVGPNPIVYLGLHKINDLEIGEGGEALATVKTFIHPNYTGNVRDGADIALLRLERPSKLQVPRLPSPETTLKDGDTFITLGWGRTTTNGPLPNALQEASGLIFVPNENCNYQDVWNGLIKNDMICAGGIGGDACKGDSGGPLVVADEPGGNVENGTARFDVLMGITSFGPEDCLTFGQPGVYTSVSSYLDWILYIFENPSTPSRKFSHSETNTGGPTLQLPDGTDAMRPVARSIQVLGNNHCEYECELSQGTKPSDGVLYECREVIDCSVGAKSSSSQKKDPNWPRLFEAAAAGNIKGVKNLLPYVQNVNEIWAGETPLHIASERGHKLVVQVIRYTQLNRTTQRPKIITKTLVFEALLAAGALSNMATSDENESPLHKAVKGGDSSILVMLIRAGANVNSQDAQGKMPLHLAAETGQSYISEILVAAKSLLDVGDSHGQTPLHYAAKRGFLTIIELLMLEGAGNKTDKKGATPRDIACTCPNQSCSRACVNEPRRVKESLSSSR